MTRLPVDLAGGRRWNDAEPTLHPRQRGLEIEVFPCAILV